MECELVEKVYGGVDKIKNSHNKRGTANCIYMKVL